MNIEQEIIELRERIKILENLILNSTQKEIITKKRDTTRYMFNGKIYPKNKLVLAVITQYVKQTNSSFKQLQTTFDKSLQGSLNVVEDIEIAKQIKDCAKRYFVNKEQILNLSDGINAVVCTQWGIFNIDKFIMLAKKLGFDIQEV